MLVENASKEGVWFWLYYMSHIRFQEWRHYYYLKCLFEKKLLTKLLQVHDDLREVLDGHGNHHHLIVCFSLKALLVGT
jgi:hypothetical protein